MSEKMIVYPLRMGNGGGGVDPQVIGDLSSLLTTDKTNIVSAINENVTNISGNTTSIGNLSNLTTTDKSNLVSAINENVTNISGNTTNIGNLSNLTTTDKTNLVSAVNEVNGKFPVSIANGGTGGVTASEARANLGVRTWFNIFTNTTGTQSTITFSDGYKITDFALLKIDYTVKVTGNLWLRNSVIAVIGEGTKTNCTAMIYDGTTFKCFTRTVEQGLTTLSLVGNTRGQFNYSTSGSVSTTDEVYITHVWGYKY